MKKKKFTFHVDLDMFIPATDKEKEYLVKMRPSSTFFKDGMKRLYKNKVAFISLILILLITISSIVLPIFWPYSYENQLGVRPGETVDASYNNLKPFEYGTTEQEMKAVPDAEQTAKDLPQPVIKTKELPAVGNPENTVTIGGKLIEIKPTKLKYQRNRTALFYK